TLDDHGGGPLAAARRRRAAREIGRAAERGVVEPVDAALDRDADAGRIDREVGARTQIARVERLAAAERDREQRLAGRIEPAVEMEVVELGRRRSQIAVRDELGVLTRRRVLAWSELGAERCEVRRSRLEPRASSLELRARRLGSDRGWRQHARWRRVGGR